ncbi:MAG: SMP-30/gluconolactonase/LRE family protein [Gemmatimonadales bacterium]
MSLRTIALAALALGTGATAGRAMTTVQAAADSARAARAAWRSAGESLRGANLLAALGHLRRAMDAWPGQPAYAFGYARVAARLRDTNEVARGLSLLADLGGGADLSAEEFAPVLGAPAVRAVRARLAENQRPIARSRLAATVNQADFWPEAVAHDARSGSWYLGSIRHRKIVRVHADGRVEEVVRPAQDGLFGVLGVRIDTAANALWVSTAALPQMQGFTPADSGRSGVFAFDLRTGRLRGRWLLPEGVAHLLGDLVVTPGGDVYATDSGDPAIWRIRRGDDRIEEFLRHPSFRSLQGPALDETGRTLFVADWSHGVFAIDLVTRTVRELTAPPRTTTLGIDGLSWDRGALIGVQNGIAPPRIVRLALDAGRTRVVAVEVLDRNLPFADEPTIGCVSGRMFYYVANSLWEKHNDLGRPRTGARLEGPRILALPLP